MSTKNQGGQAKELVLLFYDKTGLKFTNRDIMIAVTNTKKLMNSGFTYDEIKGTIEYCITNPPEKGIYSFGFIVNQISRVVNIINNQNKQLAKTEGLDKSKFNDYGLSSSNNKDKLRQREVKVDTSIFE